MKQEKEIQNVSLSFTCTQNWDSMTVCGNGRFCTVCQKIVYDFTDKSQKDYEIALRQHNGKMCGRFQAHQTKSHSMWTRAAALAALSFTAACGNAQTVDSLLPSPPPLIGEIERPIEQKDKDNQVFLMPEQSPAFLGGQNGIVTFIKNNLQYPKIAKENQIQGTVYISFIVETDGSLTNIAVKRGIGGGCNEEAVRLVNLMLGQWKVGKQNGKPVRVAYMMPIKFRLD
jgi:TonB family protein